MKPVTSRSRANIVSLITLIIILFTFGYYYFFYTKHREQLFKEKGFRIIERVGENVGKKYLNYKNIVTNVVSSVDQEFIKKQINNIDTIHSRLRSLSFPEVINVQKITYKSKPLETSRCKINASLGDEEVILKLDYLREDGKDGFDATMEYKTSVLFNNTLRYGFFNRYIVFTDSDILYSDIPVSLKENYYKSLKRDSVNLLSTAMHELTIDAKKHLVFLVPVNLDDKTIHIGGIVEHSQYVKNTRSLPPITYTIIAFILIILVLSLPYLKLIMISAAERLNTVDAFLSFSVKVLGSALVAIILLYFIMQIGTEKNNRRQFLQNNARLIETTIQDEIKKINKQIDLNERYLERDSFAKQSRTKYPFDSKIKDKSVNIYYNNYQAITWMNEKAQQLIKWNREHITPRVDIPHRTYFKMVNENRLWKDKNYSATPFYFGSIYSITEGKHYVVVSKASTIERSFEDLKGLEEFDDSLTSPASVMVSTDLQSLEKLLLPENVSYMVIDKRGDVVLAGDKSKILQENLLKELNEKPALKESVATRKDTLFVQDYDTRRRMFFVKSLGDLPLFLVTYLDYRFDKTVDIQVIGMTTLLYALLFLLMFSQLMLFLYIDYDFKRKTKGHNLFFKWFWPNESKRWNYFLLCSYYLLSIIIFLASNCHEQVIGIFGYFSLIVTVTLIVLRNYKSLRHFSGKWQHVLYFSGSFGLGLFLLLLPASSGSHSMAGNYVFILLSIALPILNFSVTRTHRYLPSVLKLQGLYNSLVYLLIVIMGLVPAVSYYKHAWEFEKNNYLQNLQLDLAKQVHNDNPSDSLSGKQQQKINLALAITDMDTDCPVNTNPPDQHAVQILTFLNGIRLPVYKDENLYTLTTVADTNHHIYFTHSNEKMVLHYFNKKVCSSKFRFSLFQNLYDFPGRYWLIIPLLLVVGFLYGLFKLIKFWTGRIFLLGTLPYVPENLQKILQGSGNFIVVSPAFTRGLEKLRNNFKRNHLLIDLDRNTPETKIDEYLSKIHKEKPGTVIISDFEGADPVTLLWKVQFLAKFNEGLRKGNLHQAKIIIYVPCLKLRNVAAFQEQVQENVLRYMELVSEFSIGYMRVDKFENDGIGKLTDKNQLNSMDKEDRILLEQAGNELHYRSIWNNCSRNEQYLIFDLAQDGLLNLNNLPDIYNLLHKGVFIVKDGRVQLFSDSFQNFVLTLIDSDEVLDIEKKARMSGKWSNYQFPIILVIFALLIFLFITQQEVFNYLIGWFTAALGSIPILTRALAGLSGLKLLKFTKG